MAPTHQPTKQHAPYAGFDPDRLEPPDGLSEWAREEFRMKWYHDDDLRVFQKALHAQDNDLHPATAGHSHMSRPSSSSLAPTVEPVRNPSRNHQPAQQRTKTSRPHNDFVREGWAYHISRWPILSAIGLAFLLEFLIYVTVRQVVRLFEKLMSGVAQEGRLRRKLQTAENYAQWKQIALELDELLGLEQWKRNSSNAYYDSASVRRVIASLERSRTNNDAETLKDVLTVCMRANFAGIESLRLYSQTHLGTKTLIENYVDEVEKSIIYIRETPLLSPQEKTTFFRRAAKNLGTSALCLSGGATFGFYHLGVIKALLDERLIPTVITGTSAGALIAAFLCTHTDEELDRLLVPELADMITPCEDPISVWLPRMIKTGARFDTVLWAKKSCFFTMGSMTFLEAYERTGRILNVSVIPHDVHSPTTLLNYITAPNCVIFSAVLASSAIPLVLNPVVLLEKTKEGQVRPWQFQGKHKDGSLRVDVPLESLHLYFNTSFSIVSQVNPHIHLFFFEPRGAPGEPVAHRKGKGWRGGFFMSAVEQYMKIELTKNLRVIRDLELMPLIGGQTLTAIFLQRFEGSVTIWPHSRFRDWFNILTDPDRKELARMIDVGKRVTWPRIRMIENRLRIERQVFQGRKETKKTQEPTIPNPPIEDKPRRSRVFLEDSEIASAAELERSNEVYEGLIQSGSEFKYDTQERKKNLSHFRMSRERRHSNKRLSQNLRKNSQLLDDDLNNINQEYMADEAATASSAGEDLANKVFNNRDAQVVYERRKSHIDSDEDVDDDKERAEWTAEERLL